MTTSPAPRLRRGRHDLSREEVAAVQRDRILHALAETMAERGYADTPVAAIIERAGVSRETFYQLFRSKQHCFTVALEQTVAALGDTVTVHLGGPGGALERFDAVLRAYLRALAGDPATARLFLVETYAAGPAAMRRRTELQGRFVDGIAQVFGVAPDDPRGRLACEALVATTVSLVTARLVDDDVAGLDVVGLDSLRPSLVDLAGTLLAP